MKINNSSSASPEPPSNPSSEFSLVVAFEPQDNKRLANLCGELGGHIKIIQAHLGVKVLHRGCQFLVSGKQNAVQAAAKSLEILYEKTLINPMLTSHEVHMSMQGLLFESDSDPSLHQVAKSSSIVAAENVKKKKEVEMKRVENSEDAQSVVDQINSSSSKSSGEAIAIKTRKAGLIMAKGANQLSYLQSMLTHDVNFGVGPAGTGKTFLAVLCAVDALEKEIVNRIILVRPAVEAGESLGFLPGDFSQKVEPYLRPLYDALHDLMGPEWVQKYAERGQIEVAPLAYMRGRTLNDAFIILDEAQNTTQAQMKMFLTRLGFGSTAVITGDLTQIDLPGKTQSGLIHALDVLKNVEGIGITRFKAQDAVRHRLVQRIINAYDQYK